MLTDLARETLLRPRQFLARLLALPLGARGRWEAFAAVVLLGTLVSWLSLRLLDPEGRMMPAMFSPLMLVVGQAILLLMAVAAIHLIGRGFGGHGRFTDSLLAMAVAEAVMVVVQVVQTLLFVLLPPLAEILGLASILLFGWVLANFIMEVHGFRSLARVGLGLLAALVALSVAASLVLGLATQNLSGV